MNPLPTTEGVRNIGEELFFEYHCLESPESQDAELWYRSHQKVTVLGFVACDGLSIPTRKERDEDGCPIVYEIKFADGFINQAFEDELLDTKEDYFRHDPPERGHVC